MSENFPSTYVKGFHKDEWVRKMKYVPLGNTGMVVSKISIGAATLCSAFYG